MAVEEVQADCASLFRYDVEAMDLLHGDVDDHADCGGSSSRRAKPIRRRVLEEPAWLPRALSRVLDKWLRSLVIRRNAADLRVFNNAGFCESLIYACVAGYLFR